MKACGPLIALFLGAASAFLPQRSVRTVPTGIHSLSSSLDTTNSKDDVLTSTPPLIPNNGKNLKSDRLKGGIGFSSNNTKQPTTKQEPVSSISAENFRQQARRSMMEARFQCKARSNGQESEKPLVVQKSMKPAVEEQRDAEPSPLEATLVQTRRSMMEARFQAETRSRQASSEHEAPQGQSLRETVSEMAAESSSPLQKEEDEPAETIPIEDPKIVAASEEELLSETIDTLPEMPIYTSFDNNPNSDSFDLAEELEANLLDRFKEAESVLSDIEKPDQNPLESKLLESAEDLEANLLDLLKEAELVLSDIEKPDKNALESKLLESDIVREAQAAAVENRQKLLAKRIAQANASFLSLELKRDVPEDSVRGVALATTALCVSSHQEWPVTLCLVPTFSFLSATRGTTGESLRAVGEFTSYLVWITFQNLQERTDVMDMGRVVSAAKTVLDGTTGWFATLAKDLEKQIKDNEERGVSTKKKVEQQASARTERGNLFFVATREQAEQQRLRLESAQQQRRKKFEEKEHRVAEGDEKAPIIQTQEKERLLLQKNKAGTEEQMQGSNPDPQGVEDQRWQMLNRLNNISKQDAQRIRLKKEEAEHIRLDQEAEAERIKAEQQAEAERIRLEKEEAEGIRLEQEAEANRIKAEQQAEAERIRLEREEAERIRLEQEAEANRIKAEQQAEAERIRLEKEEAERIRLEQEAEADRIKAEQQAEAERIQLEREEAERIRLEQEAEANRIKAEQQAEAERIQLEREEAERIRLEQEAEANCIKAEQQAEAERIQLEREEAERIRLDQEAEANRIKAEQQAEAERIRLEREEAERIRLEQEAEADRIKAEQQAEAERIQLEREEAERIRLEQEAEADRIKAEQQAEAERIQLEKEEAERIRLEQEAEANRIKAERIRLEKEEAECIRLEQEAEADCIKAEQLAETERIRLEKEEAERIRLEQEAEAERIQLEEERIEIQRLEKEAEEERMRLEEEATEIHRLEQEEAEERARTDDWRRHQQEAEKEIERVRENSNIESTISSRSAETLKSFADARARLESAKQQRKQSMKQRQLDDVRGHITSIGDAVEVKTKETLQSFAESRSRLESAKQKRQTNEKRSNEPLLPQQGLNAADVVPMVNSESLDPGKISFDSVQESWTQNKSV